MTLVDVGVWLAAVWGRHVHYPVASDWRAISARDDKSHKLWTDDYLAAFAQAGDLTLATLDRKLPGRYPSVRVESLLS